MPIYPTINGLQYSYSSVEININGISYVGVKSISWSDGLDPGVLNGTSAVDIGTTRGKYSADGSIEIYLESANVVVAALATGFYERTFSIDVHHSEFGLPIITTNLRGVRFKKRSADYSEGNDALTRKFDLYVRYVIENGVTPISNMVL